MSIFFGRLFQVSSPSIIHLKKKEKKKTVHLNGYRKPVENYYFQIMSLQPEIYIFSMIEKGNN